MGSSISGLYQNTKGAASNTPAFNTAGSKKVQDVDKVIELNNSHSLPQESIPNSVIQNVKNDQIVSERYYGSSGKPYLDIDYTDHGNAKMHPIVPHEHEINFINGKFHRDHIGREISK